MAHPSPRRRIAVATLALVSGLAVSAPLAPASADPGHAGRAPTVVATGLNNPRHVEWRGGGLYVAEAGIGGSGPCFTGPEGRTCYGASGSITRVKHDRQRRVVTGLPSVAPAGGNNAIGPSDLDVRGRRFTVALGLGANPGVRADLPRLGKKLATVSTGRFGRPGLRVLADIGRFEARRNPDGGALDTNPVGLLVTGNRTYVTDAGGNALLRVRRNGSVRTTAVFGDTQVPAPPFLGLPPGATIPMQAVPTEVAKGPDGALYVSQLTGFPFPIGGASIWRVVPGQEPTRYATGLTNVTDLAFGKDGALYAVQIADQSLLAPEPTGSLVRIRPGADTHTTVVDGLAAPYGVALHGRSAYVTTCSVCPGGGEVLRVPLHGGGS